VPEERVRRVPLALDPEFARSALEIDQDGGRASGDGEDGGRAFPAGRLVLTAARQAAGDRDKGIDLLIKAMSSLSVAIPDVSLIVIGDGPDGARLKRVADECGVGPRVHFLGSVSSGALAAAYRRCDVFALPSRKEGFGLVFVEAMAFGKPVVGGAHGGTPDIIEDGVTGFLVCHGDVDKLTRALERLLTDERLRREMGQRAQERVWNTYLFEHFQGRLTEVLDQLMS
jgi:glycosyltransferase involved in cell wall biosynthesis